MDFDWPEESPSLRREAVEFGRSLNDGILDRTGRFPVEKWRRLGIWGVSPSFTVARVRTK